ncbi:MAG: nickel pincer cofactor biosynthesis protein LarC [Firmicutes bacterium]|nr:nickel pincer cofactor biosynthesis protein LarC [Bacillota bacterium]
MILGALIDAGLDRGRLEAELRRLPVEGWRLEVEPVMRGAIRATHVGVVLDGHSHVHRHLGQILEIIDAAGYRSPVAERAKQIFRRLAEAEARVHGSTPDEVHFHEVGAVDAIVDVVGSVVGTALMGIDRVWASSVNTGQGWAESEHGPIPVPAPATTLLLRGVPAYSSGVQAELATPTGVAVLTTLAEGYGALPEMVVEQVGYGAGSRQLSQPNVLRLITGVSPPAPGVDAGAGIPSDVVTVLEANIDDMNPQFYEHVMDSLFRAGALDVYLQPAQMKKNRPGVMLGIVAPPEKKLDLARLLLAETTTLGVRLTDSHRLKADREVVTVTTPYGESRVKVARLRGKVVGVAPEYEDCRRLARETGRPLRLLYEEVRQAAAGLLGASASDS